MEYRPRSRTKLIVGWALVGGVPPGIIFGIWMGQDHWIGLAAILGWFFLPATIFKIITQGQFPSGSIEWLQFFSTLTYPLAFVFYLICGYAVTRNIGRIRYGLYCALLAAGFTALAAIIPGALTMIIVQNVSFTPANIGGYLYGALSIVPPILPPLMALAALGGYVGAYIGRQRGRLSQGNRRDPES